MKTQTLQVIKKNRKYFACKTASGYKCKLIINERSENLELGEHDLLVHDRSVRSKYGTDLIFEMEANLEESGICSLIHDKYNSKLVESCRNLGGRWDSEEKAWIFPKFVEDKIEELDELYNSDTVNIEITAKNDFYSHTGPIEFLGYRIASATGRDSGAKIAEGVALISGKVDSGGSMKNWATDVFEGATLRLTCPSLLLEQDQEEKEKWDIKII
jgi:hypothetical protein